MEGLKLVFLGMYLIFIKSGLTVGEDSFTVTFMTSTPYTGNCTNDLVLYIAASTTTNCSISAPNSNYYTNVITTDVDKVILPRSLALVGSGIEQKGINIVCNSSVTVYGINACYGNSDGFSVIPNIRLGNEYFALTVAPSNILYHSQVAVVSLVDNTNVSVRLPTTCNCQVTINNHTYGPGSYIIRILNAYETLQIQSTGNLAGTHISCNKPVAVFSGNDRTVVNGEFNDHLVTQIPPVNSWGKQFVAVSPFKTNMPVYIMTETNGTRVNISCTGTNTTQSDVVNVGDIYQKLLSSDAFCFIETDYPVLAVQVIGQDPSLLTLAPVDQYSVNYSFILPKMSNGAAFDNYFIYVIDDSPDSYLMLDSQAILITETTYKSIPGTNLLGGYIRITDGLHHVSHPSENFNGVLFGDVLSIKESYAISLGWNWKSAFSLLTTTDERSSYISTSADHLTTSSASTYISTITDITETYTASEPTSNSYSFNSANIISTSTEESLTVLATTSTNTASVSDTTPQDAPVCPNNLQGTHFVDMARGHNGFEIIADYVMMSIFECAIGCRRQDQCTSFQYNTQTSSCFLLRVGEGILDPTNGQIFTLEC